jgi:aspartyl-tRNA(Asn)/glutamyl-tRNA(Gln) amidotransferase subunit A
MNVLYKNYRSLREALDAGGTSCRAVAEFYLKNIADKNPKLNAFLEVYSEECLKRADEIDLKIKNGTAGKLAGMVVGLKDVISYQGHKLTAGSKILDGFVAKFNATVVEKLLNEDALIIGRQNCDEFAMGSSNENSAYGNVLNALGENLVPGGSSGGSAVGVQADMCMISLGSDTGGSVRQPASFCGIVGFKPTYSRISRWGLIAYASSFDSIGIFAKNIEDTALVLEVIAGEDAYDSTVSKKEVPQYSQILDNNKKAKIAYIKETVENEGLQPEVQAAILAKIADLRAKGHTVEEVNFPYLDYLLPIYYIITTAEASTNLSRFDGVRYGHRATGVKDVAEMYKKSRSEGFGKEVQRRIVLGTFVLSADYHDAYFAKAQKVRRIVRDYTREIFSRYDFIILPTSPTTAFPVGQFEQETVKLYLADIFTVQANLTGVPAVSVPCGADSKGLPIGLQIMADSFKESELLAFAKNI